MKNPVNRFKAALKSGEHQLGIWNSVGGNSVPEMLATCGYDWILVDTEHSPVETVEVLTALQAIGGYPDVSAVVRPANNDAVLIKRILDMGAQSLLIPYVQSAEEARAAVSAVRYAPKGMRGVAGMTRATRYGTVDDYFNKASDEICLLVQVETRIALDRLEEIAGTEGVDGVFIGPADLSASLGFPGQPNHPEVVAAIEDAFARLKKIGVPSGILTLNEAFAKRCVELGTAFTAVGVDLVIMAEGARALRDRFTG